MIRFLLVVGLILAVQAQASAQTGLARRFDGWAVIAVETEAGETMTVRLAGIELPRPGAPGHALAMQAVDGLLEESGPVTVISGDAGEDRYGHVVADLDLGGQTLAGSLVLSGYALAYSWPETREAAAALLELEIEARQYQGGLWGSGVFSIRSPDPNTLALYLETVQIVEARVISVGQTRERTYLNFGFDYRSDFTVSIAQEDVQHFEDAGVELSSLEGRIVRVRGWLQAINGPSISIDHPERIEIITPLDDID
ncbi:thermonuclease family protein [Hyphobacterium sp.]|uniref:thermonuclease family protein n=1 Tax=Hyphobacterium sp. TaxID=2004662 RepID=UPI003B52EADA